MLEGNTRRRILASEAESPGVEDPLALHIMSSARIIHQVLEHGGALGEFGLGRRLNGFWIEFARSAHNGPLPNFVFRVDGRRY